MFHEDADDLPRRRLVGADVGRDFSQLPLAFNGKPKLARSPNEFCPVLVDRLEFQVAIAYLLVVALAIAGEYGFPDVLVRLGKVDRHGRAVLQQKQRRDQERKPMHGTASQMSVETTFNYPLIMVNSQISMLSIRAELPPHNLSYHYRPNYPISSNNPGMFENG
jgi:hypothetical protein